MRRISTNKKMLSTLIIAAILQIIVISIDQIIINQDRKIQKIESSLFLSEIKIENIAFNEDAIVNLQNFIDNTIIKQINYSSNYSNKESFIVEKNFANLFIFVIQRIGDSFLVEQEDELLSVRYINNYLNRIEVENFQNNEFSNFKYIVKGNLKQYSESYIQLHKRVLNDFKELMKKSNRIKSTRHRLLLISVITQILSLFTLLLFFIFAYSDTFKMNLEKN